MINNTKDMNKLLKIAFILSIITIVYNIGEGIISIFFGYSDETLSLFGFGVDSFVEVISGIGIAHMIGRMKFQYISERDKFEKSALLITGISFYILTAGLIAGSVINIITGSKPVTTIWGIIISLISLATMWILFRAKVKVGTALDSKPILADANCTKTCFYLSIILLVSSLCYEIFKVGYLDVIGSLGIAYFSFKEGREAIESSKKNDLSCSCCHDDCK